ncbi:MAG: plasmid replication protein, CyRepA1 family [Spirulinaceae cyanobacterium]
MIYSPSKQRLIPTNRFNPCPVCSDISGDCRHGENELILCHTYIDGGVDAPGYEFKKSGKLGNWGVYAPPREAKDWLPKELWIRQQQQLRAKLEADKRRQYQEALSVFERDKAIRKIAKSLGLKAEHREDLKHRGLNDDQIELGLFFSITPYAPVPSDIPSNLPGIGHGGKLLSNSSGYACVAFDNHRKAIGWQIRVDGATEAGKYRWAKGLKSSHLKNGELPLTVVGEDAEETNRVHLTEGFLKPYIAQSKHGGKWLGSPGGNFSGSPEQFKLATAKAEIAIIYPDAGDVLNPHVMKRWRNQIGFAQNRGLKVLIAWWGQVSKELWLDIDEIKPGQTVKYLSPEEFYQLSQIQKKKKEDWDRWIKSRRLSPHTRQKQRFVKISPLAEAKAILVKSGTGTGKTHEIKRIIKENPNKGFLSIGYRNGPLLQFCIESGFYHLQSELKNQDEYALIHDPRSCIAFCLHSILHFSPEDFDDRILILDEIVSILRSLAKDKNLRFKSRVKALLIEALTRASKIYCLDGHLTNKEVRLIGSVLGEEALTSVIENSFTGHRPQTKFITNSRNENGELVEPDKSEVLKAILNLPEGVNIAVCSDNQKELEALDNKLKARGIRTFRLDSTKAGTKQARQFYADSPGYLVKHRIQVLLYSPSGEAGLNIDIKGYFSEIYALFYGVLSTNQQMQLIARVRDKDAALIVVPATRAVSNDEVSDSFIPDEVKQAWEEYAILNGEAVLDGVDSKEQYLKLMQQMMSAYDDEFYVYECQLRAAENYERQNLKQCLRYALEDSGYPVTDVIVQKYNEVTKGIAEEKKAVEQANATQEFHSPYMTTEEANEKSRDISATVEQKAAVKKRRLLDRLPGIEEKTIITSETVEATNSQTGEVEEKEVKVEKPAFSPETILRLEDKSKRLISKQELRFFVDHPEMALLLDRHKLFQKFNFFTDPESNGYGLGVSPIEFRSKTLLVKTLIEMGIKDFLEPGTSWNQKDQRVLDFQRKGRKNWRKLRFKVGKYTPVQYLNKAIRMLGFQIQRRKVKGERTYSIKDELGSLESVVYQCVTQRIEDKVSQSSPDFQFILNRIKPPIPEDVEDAADILAQINTFEDFQEILYPTGELAQGFSANLMRKATKLLEKSKQAMIAQWLWTIKAPT